MRVPRWLLFGVAMSSLVLLTYAGVVFAFSVPVTPGLAQANADAPEGARAVVVPIGTVRSVATLAEGRAPALLASGRSQGSFPSSASDVRMGQALAYVEKGANGTIEVANLTLDVGALSGGSEGWIVKAANERDAWFTPKADTLGQVARYERPAFLALLLALGTVGFLAPLVAIIVTHKGARAAPGRSAAGAPQIVCAECRAPLAAGTDFCTRCGAYRRAEADAHG
ncbi:MAG TPA: hypothetical protein VM370_01430 [Candidatus Thermoplasmatota archaeon]|nr:hypothetical protein [Candidatus Thermoplasmatota archaeon]